MRFQILAGALVVSLTASAVALASTCGRESARPDLVVSSLSNPPAVVIQGGSFPVKDRTRNIGGASARATVTQYYLSSSGHRTAAGRRSVIRLRARRSSLGSADAKVSPTLGPGTYSLLACADGARAVKEANERNNCRTAATSLVVKKPPPPV
jgi:subtilase family serine protease